MTTEQEALGRRAVACPGWKWLRGCPWERPPSGAPDDGGDKGEADWRHDPPTGALPDLSEPAGVGCLVALAREALGEPKANACTLVDGEWAIARRRAGVWVEVLSTLGSWGTLGVIPDVIREGSEPAVWVAALEAAGRRE